MSARAHLLAFIANARHCSVMYRVTGAREWRYRKSIWMNHARRLQIQAWRERLAEEA